jgi:hypothetical protein
MLPSFSMRSRMVLFLLPLPLFAFFLWLKFAHVEIYYRIIQEDHILEYQQFVFYFLAGLICFPLARKFLGAGFRLHGVLYSGLALLLLFVAFNEISWGQRIFGFETPEIIAERNVQDELTFHNLEFIQRRLHPAYILVGAFGAFAWLLRMPFRLSDGSVWRYVIPNWYVSSWFFFLFLIYSIIEIARVFEPTILGFEIAIGSYVVYRDQEPAESFLATAFLLFVIDNYRSASRLLDSSSA